MRESRNVRYFCKKSFPIRTYTRHETVPIKISDALLKLSVIVCLINYFYLYFYMGWVAQSD